MSIGLESSMFSGSIGSFISNHTNVGYTSVEVKEYLLL